jgi:hypothetical protein
MKIIYRITYPNPPWSNRRRVAGPEAAMTLGEILEVVGPLDDSPGENNARQRFRAHLAKPVTTPGFSTTSRLASARRHRNTPVLDTRSWSA